MKPAILIVALSGMTGFVQAAEVGKVISSTPVMQEVLIPQRSCRDEQVEVEQPKNPAGSVIGAVVGDQAANADKGTSVRTERRCTIQQVRSQQLAGYDVVYEYAGKRYSTRLAQDPGDTVPLQISPVGSAVSTSPLGATESVAEEEPVRVVRRVEPVYVPPVVVHWDLWPGPRGPHGRHLR